MVVQGPGILWAISFCPALGYPKICDLLPLYTRLAHGNLPEPTLSKAATQDMSASRLPPSATCSLGENSSPRFLQLPWAMGTSLLDGIDLIWQFQLGPYDLESFSSLFNAWISGLFWTQEFYLRYQILKADSLPLCISVVRILIVCETRMSLAVEGKCPYKRTQFVSQEASTWCETV